MTSEEVIGLVRTPPLGGVYAAIGFGVGHYGVDISRYGEQTGGELHPADSNLTRSIVPTFMAEFEIMPEAWGPVGLSLGIRKSTLDFEGCVLDAWGLCGPSDVTRLSVAALYRFR